MNQPTAPPSSPPPAPPGAPRAKSAGAGLRSRRELLRAGALALAAAAGPAAFGAGRKGWLSRLLGATDEGGAEIFAGGAPRDELWRQWSARGWVREALYYRKLGPNVQCKLCPNNCLLAPGDRSHCRNRVNIGGTMYTMAYGDPCTFHADPVEKKPLFHFLPGSTTFSLATSGCVFRCLNCQNWDISQKKPEETKDPTGPELRLRPPLPERLSLAEMGRLSLFPEDMAATARALGCASVAYTYSEPTAYYEYALASCRAVREGGLRNIMVTCGSINDRPLRDILTSVDGAHIDLKGFDDDVYRRLNSGRLWPILDTLKTYKEMGVWFEVINLIVPTYTDDLATIRRMCDWIVANLGPDTPLHFSRFHPQHKLDHLSPTPTECLLAARQAAKEAGLRYPYIGNVSGVADAGTTFCPGCGQAVIERDVFAVTANRLVDGACPGCRAAIAGVWA